MTYPDGNQIAVGDSVTIMYSKVQGVVEEVISSPQQMSNWGVDEPGVMLLSVPFGRVFYPRSCFDEEKLSLVARTITE